MMIMFRQYLAIMRHEVLMLWHDTGLRHIMLWVSLLGLCLFLVVYRAQTITAIPTVVLDLDHSSTSRQLVDQIANTENLNLVASVNSFDDLKFLINAGRVIAGVVVPENYGRDLSLGRQTRILAIIDASNMFYATNASSAFLTVSRTISAQAGIRTLVANGVQFNDAQDAYQTVDFQEEPWFNPALNYAYFLVLALALNIWQQCCTLAACMTVAGETGRDSWLQIRATGISRLSFFSGKALVQLAAFLLMALPVFLLNFLISKSPLQCGFPVMLLFTLTFALAIQSLGTMMSSLARNPVDASRLGMIIALPSFVLSGYTWPIEAMPHWLQSLVWVLPQTWFFQGFNYLAFKNPGWSFISRYFLALLIIAGICYGVAAIAISLGNHGSRRAES